MCNLKSNKTLTEILEYKKTLKNLNINTEKEFVLFPSSIYLSFFYDSKYKIGSQNISKYFSGSHTGEILASQLKSLNISYVIVNHCENYETIESSIAKIKNATKENIKVVFCIGREISFQNDFLEKLYKQIGLVFKELTEEEKDNIIIAYEPCWAINKNETEDPEEIFKIVFNLKKYLKDGFNKENSIIYGGSVNINNYQNLLKIDILDGFLLGNGAIDPENVLKIAVNF